MLTIILLSCLVIVLLMFIIMTYRFHSLIEKNKDEEILNEKYSFLQGLVYTGILLTIVAIIAVIYFGLKGTIWEGHLTEWLNIIVRVMHITFGIAWIGASFYFIFLENALNRTENIRDELAGNLWAVHGGGFYYLEKYKIAPKEIPKNLHWFKYESYFTWVTGICLLFIVYYFNAQGFLIDTNVLNIGAGTAISISISSFIFAWLIYNGLCRSPLIKNGKLFSFIGFIILIGFAYFYAHVFSARAAYIHFGAMIGTIMTANVFFIIIPSQKAMVFAAKHGKPLNPEIGKHAGMRSLHNNYFTLPVLFVMVSNHFPSTFGNENKWLVLIIISLGAAGVKHYLNLKERGELSYWVMPISVIILLAAAFITAPKKVTIECKPNISITEITTIINKRCITCHSLKPTDDIFKAPPNGVVYDTPQDIVKLKDKIMQRVVITKTMPQNNKTGITQEERDLIGCWIDQGASLK